MPSGHMCRDLRLPSGSANARAGLSHTSSDRWMGTAAG